MADPSPGKAAETGQKAGKMTSATPGVTCSSMSPGERFATTECSHLPFKFLEVTGSFFPCLFTSGQLLLLGSSDNSKTVRTNVLGLTTLRTVLLTRLSGCAIRPNNKVTGGDQKGNPAGMQVIGGGVGFNRVEEMRLFHLDGN